MTQFRTHALWAAPLALALALTGCAGTSGTDHPAGHSAPAASSAPDATADFADADVMFASMMIPHHAQAVEMSDMVLADDGVAQAVRDLAQQIKDAQAPEIELMQSWLDDWGVTAAVGGHAAHGDDGMMTEADMTALKSAAGAEAARLYLEGMIMHHEGAVEMAEAELKDGANTDALELAQTIIDTQNAEIETMKAMLAAG